MTTKPVYCTTAEIGRHLGYVAHHITALVKNWHNHPTHPCPAPDAYVTIKGGGRAPLWLYERLHEWETWNNQRPTRHGKPDHDHQ